MFILSPCSIIIEVAKHRLNIETMDSKTHRRKDLVTKIHFLLRFIPKKRAYEYARMGSIDVKHLFCLDHMNSLKSYKSNNKKKS